MTTPLLPILPVVDDVLFYFAQSDGFWANLETAFGTSYDVVKATQLRQQWQSRNFSQIPPIEVLSDEVLGTANGAYASSTNKIYLSASFLNTASSASIINVILEEIGHYVDAQINQVDSAGDEGAIFAELVRGNSLDVATLDALRAENDQTTIIVNGEIIQVEQADFTGTNGNDNITGTSDSDNIFGLDGNDTLSGLGGSDNIYGGNGNDSLNGGDGSDYFTNDAGNDTINGGSGTDRYEVDYSSASSGLTMTYNTTTGSGTITVGTETDTFTSIESFNGFKGTEYNDVIFGGTESEFYYYYGALSGGSGNDTISGNAGFDEIYGEDGNDVLNGGADNDQLYGGSGNDSLNGDAGDDYFTNEDGNDTINGGSGIDRYEADYSYASSGLTMTYNTATGSGTITVGTETDTFTSIENFNGFKGTEYNDVIFGGTENEYYEGGLKGGGGNDTISGNAGFDEIYGEDGNDVLNGGVGNDQLYGGNGNDLLNGDSGDDYFTGDEGNNDTINGGAGSDRYHADYSYGSSGLTMTYDTAGSGTITVGTETDTFTSIESFGQTSPFKGTEYNDVIFGGIERDRLSGGRGNDTISGNAGNDEIYGDDGNDVLNGGAGYDDLSGGNGNDTLQGTNSGIGESDALRGGTENDLFILGDTTRMFYDDGFSTTGGTSDYAIIYDFNPTDDIIQLRGSSSDYLLTVSGSTTNLYINKPGTEPDELIAYITDQTALSLTASYFSYVSSPTLPSITLAVSPSSVTEDGTTNLVYTFTRTGSTTSALTANYTVGGTATNGTDYTSIPTSVTFAAGSSTATVTFDPTADTTVEPDETVILTLAAGTGYTVGTPNAATGTITNDDSASISINDVTVSEGNSGTTNAVFTVTLSNPVDTSVTLNYSTANGTATTADNDYTAIATTPLTFNVGETSKTITVAVNGDTKVENNETFFLNLSNLQANGRNVTITDNQGQGTINDDDSTVTSQLSINDITVVEGQNSNAILTVTVNNPSTQPISVNYTTAPINATANVDYTSKTGTITIAPNTATATISIPILNDNLNEPDEAFTVTLSNAVNATINPDEAIGQVIITDTLQSSITRTLPNNVENLRLIGSNNINGTGNAGDNKITGNSGNNILAGANGNDIYCFNASTPLGSDTIQETTTGGIDTLDFTGTNTAVRVNLGTTAVQTAVTNNLKLTFSANNTIENIISDSGNDRLTGNSLNNTLTGGGGNDQLTGQNGNDSLIGGFGDDLLTGGNGSDNFIFNSSNLGIDAISDFTSGSDKIVLSKAIFTALQSIIGNGFSQPAEFASVADDDLVATSSAFIVYSTSSGSIYYNQNGSAAGLGSGSEFANLLTVPTLIAADFALIN
ncbi:MAG: M10 family metallopeptidase C-terminal domain-containing protein [Microcystis sp. LE18-22.4A]|uniref:beta strand repeat-containing protein n=1 Tax=Microcystis sp. LE18-22.4A TaxID=3016432 RepID=UPI0022CB20D7|nr:Calx-beta domain-containing protein [Microcystis sp. LE18-22.4A]MCZ8118971.1 M10 family metallopeptidase C-terminal domain-containing protein [Microcystis sp. LE18-22.4A]